MRPILLLGLALAVCAASSPPPLAAQAPSAYEPLAPTSARYSAETRRVDSLYAAPATVYLRNELREDVRALEAQEAALEAYADSVRRGEFRRHALNDALDSLAAERRSLYERVGELLEWATPAQRAEALRLLKSWDATGAAERQLLQRADSLGRKLTAPATPTKPRAISYRRNPPPVHRGTLSVQRTPESVHETPTSVRDGALTFLGSSAAGFTAGALDGDRGGYQDSFSPGSDKQAHAFASMVGGRMLTDHAGAGWGLASCVAMGAALEFGQRQKYRSDPPWQADLAYDAMGCAAGTAWSPRGRRAIANGSTRLWRAITRPSR